MNRKARRRITSQARGADDPAARDLHGALAAAASLRQAGRLDEAERLYRQILASAPDQPTALNWLGALLHVRGDNAGALDLLTRAARLSPREPLCLFHLAEVCRATDRQEDAVRAYRRALACQPATADLLFGLGTALLALGQADAAARELGRAVAAAPDAPQARISLNFAVAKLHQSTGDPDAAFAHFRAGNALKARTLGFDPARHSDFVDRCIATFDRDFFAARRGWGVASETPVFILGMPRSGTTLVEQILSAHPDVHGAGELDDFRPLVRDLPAPPGATAGFPDCARALGRDACDALARGHLDSLAQRFTPAARVTDKMTGNYLRLGLIAMLLPRATVIHCRRDPLDTCLSCYFQNFANGLSFTYDLGHLGLVYRQYARLMAHWREVLPLRILDVRYESLVAAPETVSREIVDFCNLPWNARCLAFHQHERQVQTASLWQVRQPIYASSVNRWQAYADHLGPLREALGMAGDGTA